MPITIGSNIAALNAQRRLSQTTHGLRGVFEHLSSGLRINRAADDAAGLAVADSLKVDTRVALQGVRNLNDALSLTNIADGATNELSTIIVRLRELAEQSANGTLGNNQRKALDDEAQALSDEYFRIARTTSFNGLNLFDGSVSEIVAQAGYGFDGGVRSGLGGLMGNGTFGATTSFATGAVESEDMTLADLDGDGWVDLVTAGGTGSAGYVTTRLGTGNGTFGGIVSYSMGGVLAADIEVGDVNGDGVLDIVTSGYVSGPTDGFATVRLGRGDGTFGSATTFAMDGRNALSVTLGDLNGDNMLDLVTGGYGDDYFGYVTVRIGRGDGTFGAAVSYATGLTAADTVRLADFDSNGVLDVVAVGSTGLGGAAIVRFGLGDGTFGASTSYSTESGGSRDVTFGDVNGDSIADLVTTGVSAGGGYTTVRLGQGGGTFGAARSYAMESLTSQRVTLFDINSDGRLDLITAGRSVDLTGQTTVRLGTGDGTFGAATSYAAESANSLGLDLADVNGDGVLDLFSAGFSGSATLRLGGTQSGIGPLLPFSLRSQSEAKESMSILANAQNNLVKARGTVGAFQSRLSVAASTVTASAENFAAAESQLRDVDVAEESARLARLEILQQAGAAVLAQANLQPQLALQLLSG